MRWQELLAGEDDDMFEGAAARTTTRKKTDKDGEVKKSKSELNFHLSILF